MMGDEVVNRLNELSEENEKLKMFLKAVNEELDLANRDCDILEEENEQLKKELKRCRGYDYYVVTKINKVGEL